MKNRDLFNVCQNESAELPSSVVCLHGSASDNAVDTINENGGVFVQGNFTDEFIKHWAGTLSFLLTDWDCPADAREWFISQGFKF